MKEMRGKTYSGMMLTMLLVSMLALAHAQRPAEATPGTILYLDPPIIVDPTLIPGSSFTVDVMVSDVEYLYAWQVNMSFNPSVLGFVNVTEGDFLASQPEGTFPALDVKPTSVTFGWSTQGSYIGVSGSGTLATVAFEVLSEGESLLDFEEDLIYVSSTDTYTYMTYLIAQTNSTPPPNWIYWYPPNLTIQDGHFISATLLDCYNQLLANYSVLLDDYAALLSEHQDLLSQHERLQSDYASLNATCASLLDSYTQSQKAYSSLQSEYDSLTEAYDSLETTYQSLNSDYGSLISDYDDLNSKYDLLSNELTTARNLSYIFVTTTVAFIAATAYLILRRPKAEPSLMKSRHQR